MENIEITMADVNQLLQVNPIAAEQVKVIALQRVLRERTAELEELRASKDDAAEEPKSHAPA